MIIKRSPNTDAARYGLALVVDVGALLDGESNYWSERGTGRRLTLPDGTVLFADGTIPASPQFTRALSGNTQPLRLETAKTVTLADQLPPGRIAVALASITLAAIVLRAVLRQRARVHAAETRAELSGLETRLSQASRVNALGEMASGMAHELTQPLTAILAPTQAARHLAMRGETERLASVLEDVVGQTRRASAILERLRTWTKPHKRQPETIDLRDCIRVAETLLAGQVAEAGAVLDVKRPAAPVSVLADRVELEQVLFNLLKNALDEVAECDGAREVSITLTTQDSTANVDVSDTGPGVPEAIRDRLFTPFVTTRKTGTGLGLALSHRLVERAGGDLVAVETSQGARFRVILPLVHDAQGAAE